MAWWMMVPAAMQAAGTLLGADANKRAAKIEAAQMRQQANGEIAMASRAAEEAQRQSRLLQSRALAVAGNQGGSLDSPDVAYALGDIAAQGEYNALAALYEGRTAAQSLNYGAKVKRWEAKRTMTESLLGAGAQLGQGYVDVRYGQSMFDKYGGGGFDGSGIDTSTAAGMYRSGMAAKQARNRAGTYR